VKSFIMGKVPKLIRKLRPSFEEVDQYARLILQHERRPASALPECQREAEIQLWTMRTLLGEHAIDRDDRYAGA
jgi:hypothetical protein